MRRKHDSWRLAYHLLEKRVDLPVDEVTVSVDEGTGKSVLIGREN